MISWVYGHGTGVQKELKWGNEDECAPQMMQQPALYIHSSSYSWPNLQHDIIIPIPTLWGRRMKSLCTSRRPFYPSRSTGLSRCRRWWNWSGLSMMRLNRNPCKFRSTSEIHAHPLQHRIKGLLFRWTLSCLSQICRMLGGQINPSHIKISKTISTRIIRWPNTLPSQIRKNNSSRWRKRRL